MNISLIWSKVMIFFVCVCWQHCWSGWYFVLLIFMLYIECWQFVFFFNQHFIKHSQMLLCWDRNHHSVFVLGVDICKGLWQIWVCEYINFPRAWFQLVIWKCRDIWFVGREGVTNLGLMSRVTEDEHLLCSAIGSSLLHVFAAFRCHHHVSNSYENIYFSKDWPWEG